MKPSFATYLTITGLVWGSALSAFAQNGASAGAGSAIVPEPAVKPAAPQDGRRIPARAAQNKAGSAYSVATGLATLSSFGHGTRCLIVATRAPDARMLAETEEDLNVMTRVLDKAIGSKRSKSAHAMGINIDPAFWNPINPLRSLYLEGQGAVFLLSVNYPLLPPSQKLTADDSATKPADTEWQEARREVYGTHGVEGVLETIRSLKLPGETTVEYDTNRVERLKTQLTEALMNAAHLRRLTPEETVTLVVTAPGAAAPGKVSAQAEEEVAQLHFDQGGKAFNLFSKSIPERGGRSTLVIQTRKGDAESFYQGKMDFDAFQQKVKVLIY